MILRAVALAGGLAGAGSFSQFPEFSQQYVQRLGGAVDALDQVIADFDASAAAEGLSRADALAAMVGSDFVTRRRADMERTILRHDRLAADLNHMQDAGPFMRAYHGAGADGDIARAAWGSFEPAVPLSFAGVVFAGVGFLLGWAGVRLIGAVARAIGRAGARQSA